ncbi:MAG: hypothetical protein ABSF58_08110 [Solirubrobacteraceae bacterium]
MRTDRSTLSDAVVRQSSRRGFLERLGGAVIALAGAQTIASAALATDADANPYTNFCGHTYTTGNCPAPTGLPRIDRNGYPLRASDGVPVDDLGRPVNAEGQPIDAGGSVLTDADGVPLAPAPRTKVCETAGEDYKVELALDGSWYRCCGGTVRRIRDCCGVTNVRINGDAALTGYCYPGRHVFCVTYFQTSMPC